MILFTKIGDVQRGINKIVIVKTFIRSEEKPEARPRVEFQESN